MKRILLLLCLLALPFSAAAQPTTADLSITKTVDVASAAAGSHFSYTVTVRNSGPDPAAEVTLTDVLPPQLRFSLRSMITSPEFNFFCGAPTAGTNGTVTCNAPTMPSGATATLTIFVTVAPDATSGAVTNTATVTSPTADPDSADRSATSPPVALESGADLTIRKNTSTIAARPNSLISYLIVLHNLGPNAAANVVMTDVLPPELLFDSIGAPAGFTCAGPPAGTNGTVTCSAATFPASGVAGFSLRARLAPAAEPGVFSNIATVTTSTVDPPSNNAAESEWVMIVAPAGAERRIDSSAVRVPQVSPQVATTQENVLAVWREGAVPFAGGSASIRGALFRPDLPGETLIDFTAPEAGTDMAQPNVAAAGDRYLVVWRETRSSQGRLLARRIRTNGSFLDAEPLVLETGNAVVCCTDVGDPRPAVASDGRDFFVTWVSAGYEVRGIVVPGAGPIVGQPSVLSRDADARTRGRHDLEVVWTSDLYAVFWLDRVLPAEPFVLRYARVTANGVLLDPEASNSIAGPAFSSLTARGTEDGAVVTVEYRDGSYWCVGMMLLTANAEAGNAVSLLCDLSVGPPPPALHSTIVPVKQGFVLVQPGRRYAPPFTDVAIRTSTIDPTLTYVVGPTSLGATGREIAVANFRGAALLVYNRTDGTDRVSRVFAFFVQQPRGKTRAVRH